MVGRLGILCTGCGESGKVLFHHDHLRCIRNTGLRQRPAGPLDIWFHITNEMLGNNVVVGTAAGTPNRWIGEVRAFTIYNRVLVMPTIWSDDTRPDPDGLQLFYTFEKPAGGTVPNLAGTGGGLRIPERYEVPAKAVLAWFNFRHPDDLIANVIGFVPFGSSCADF